MANAMGFINLFPNYGYSGLLILSPPSHKFLFSTTTRNPNRNRNDASNQFYSCGSSFFYNYQQRSLSLVHVHALGPCVGFNPDPLSPPSLSLASHSHYLPFPFPPLRLFWYHHSLLIFYAREEYRQTDTEQIPSCHRLIIIMILWIIVERFGLLQHSAPVKGSSLSLSLSCFVLFCFAHLLPVPFKLYERAGRYILLWRPISHAERLQSRIEI